MPHACRVSAHPSGNLREKNLRFGKKAPKTPGIAPRVHRRFIGLSS
jgi:hypothetical protein